MNSLIKILVDISNKESDKDELHQQFSNLFLQYGSETPDNRECIIELCIVDKDSFGLGLKNGVLVSDIMNSAEGCAISGQVKQDYPDLTQKQWDAVLRLTTMLLLLFEHENKVELQQR